VASIDGSGDGLPPTITYLVPDWVRVRREDFGLVFYDSRSTRLTFVRSGDALVPPPFTGQRRALRVSPSENGRNPAVLRVLESLADRGLIVATEAE
jgi:putative mycofactocin binding protein MftB